MELEDEEESLLEEAQIIFDEDGDNAMWSLKRVRKKWMLGWQD